MTNEELITAYNKATSMRELQTLLGYSVSGATAKMLKTKLAALGLEPPSGRKQGKKQELEEILVQHSDYIDSKYLKVRLVKAGLLKEACTSCGSKPTWLGKLLTLQLDHINGAHTDNRLENLRLLCPNCHSQTSTWGRKTR